MSLSSGSRLGPFEIVSPLGAGGMGEVFKARDTRLGRIVAIKVLPAEFARDRERTLRLRREAATISQLNHPHICTLYDVGSENGIEYLVMEYLDGHSLADRLLKGPLPLDEALRVGAEIAEALHRAHKQGIVHRDLKPSNIMLTKSGVKLLDFGLARSVEGPDTITREGAFIGTPHYMAPEQLAGTADERTDIYALGAVLHEIVTGRRAYDGTQPVAPRELEHIIRKCLEKNPDERWQSAFDVAEQLRYLNASTAEPITVSRKERRWKAAAVVFVAAFLAVSAAALYLWRRDSRAPSEPIRLALRPPPSWIVGSPTQRPFVISPDGKHVAMMVQGMGGGISVAMMIRRLSDPTPTMVENTGTARTPFWSPDSRFVGFFADGQIRRVDLTGGTPEAICSATPTYGATWGPGGVIVFADELGVHRVRAEGANPQRILDAKPDNIYFDPVFLPDGERYLLTHFDRQRSGTVVLHSLRDHTQRVVLRNATNARWIDSGHLFFVRGQVLMAQRFDLKRAEVSGDPIVVSPTVGVLRRETMNALYSVSRDGRVLALQPTLGHDMRLVRVNQDGDTVAELAGPARIWYPAATRDGSRLAVMIEQPNGDADIWTIDLRRGAMMRATSDPSHDTTPIWSPDGRWIVYTSDGGMYRIPSGGGAREQLVATRFMTIPTDWSPDGQTILFAEYDEKGPANIKALRLADLKVTPVVATQFSENWARFSPDGEWIAYQSNESGLTETYVQRFRDGAFKTRVTTKGGAQPSWSGDGTKIYYAPFNVLDVKVGDSGVQVSPPRLLFRRNPNIFTYSFCVLPDGSVIGRRTDDISQMIQVDVLIDWTDRLP